MIILSLKSAEVTFLGTMAFTKNAVPGSNYPAAVTAVGSILL